MISPGIPKCVPKILNTSKIPLAKLFCNADVGTTKPTAMEPNTYIKPTKIVDNTITFIKVLLPPFTSFM